MGLLCCAWTPGPDLLALHTCTKWVTKSCDPCDHLRKQQTKSVAASYLTAELFISKRSFCSLSKHESIVSLLQSSPSQFLWFSPLQWKLFPTATMLLELPVGRWQCSTEAALLQRLYATPVQQPPKTRLHADLFLRRFQRGCWLLRKVTKVSLVWLSQTDNFPDMFCKIIEISIDLQQHK